MPAGKQATICVNYRNIDGYHVFTSEDVYGLYVASQDPEKAFKGVGPALQKLIRLNEHVNCRVEPADSFREFLSALRGEVQTTYIAALGSRNFVLTPAA